MQMDRTFKRTCGKHDKLKALPWRHLLTDGDFSNGHDAEADL